MASKLRMQYAVEKRHTYGLSYVCFNTLKYTEGRST